MHKKLFSAVFLVSILVVSGFIFVSPFPFSAVQASATLTGAINLGNTSLHR